MDRLLGVELALSPFDDDDDGLFSLVNDRFLDALTLSFSRPSRSRPGVSLDLLPVSLSELPASLLTLSSKALLSCGCGGGFLLGFLRICGLRGVAGVDPLDDGALCGSFPFPLSCEWRLLQPWREQQLFALWREPSSLKRRIEPPLVKRRPPTVRRPICSSMFLYNHLELEIEEEIRYSMEQVKRKQVRIDGVDIFRTQKATRFTTGVYLI
jgi:hypothetical protein